MKRKLTRWLLAVLNSRFLNDTQWHYALVGEVGAFDMVIVIESDGTTRDGEVWDLPDLQALSASLSGVVGL